MLDERRADALKRLSYIEGHLGGIRKMIEEDKYCVDILRQTYAVRKAIEKLEALSCPGRGLQATVAGQPVLIGTRSLLREDGIAIDALETQLAELEAQGKTVMLVASAGEVIGAIAVADTIKPTSARAIQQLQRLGLEVWMLTGNNRLTAEAMARQVGIAPERVLARVLPADKTRQVELLQKSGKVVAMVGDGINDAPALTQADAGIAMAFSSVIVVLNALRLRRFETHHGLFSRK